MIINTYVLRHPVTEDYFYVGSTSNVEVRFREHLSSAKKPKSKLSFKIKEITDAGLLPIIQTVDSRTILGATPKSFVEQQVIQKLLSQGCDLCNTRMSGKAAKPLYKVNNSEIKIDFTPPPPQEDTEFTKALNIAEIAVGMHDKAKKLLEAIDLLKDERYISEFKRLRKIASDCKQEAAQVLAPLYTN